MLRAVIASRTFPTATESGVMVGFPPASDMRVGLHNWQLPPFNRWGFLHTREVIPTANVSRGTGPVWRLLHHASAVDEVEFESLTGGTMTVGTFLDQSWTDGLVVLRRGEVEFEAYRNGMHDSSRHIAMSVSKSITSLVIGILVDRGLIELTAPVTRYAPELVEIFHACAIVAGATKRAVCET